MLSVWDAQLAEEGARLYLKRAGFAEKIFPLAADAHYALSGGKEELGVVYQTDMTGFSKEEAKADLIEKLSLDTEKQLRLGYTLRGPHRDDIKFTVDGVDIRKYGSQGQQRTAALSLKLAEVSLMEEITGERPVLILDDVFGEIDAARQNRLLEYIGGTQTLVAATEFNKTPRGEKRTAAHVGAGHRRRGRAQPRFNNRTMSPRRGRRRQPDWLRWRRGQKAEALGTGKSRHEGALHSETRNGAVDGTQGGIS